MKTPVSKPLRFLCLLGLAFGAAAPVVSAQSNHVGNSLTVTNGGPGGPPPLVILGEYSPAGPLAAPSTATTLPSGVVQDVKFYGQNYSFTLYALTRVEAGPNANEQTFKVVAAQGFYGSATNPGVQILPVTGFLVNAGDLLAFAGIGPYYSPNPNDATNSDATYEDSAFPGFWTATPPGGVGSEFTVGLQPDAKADYEYIPDSSGNQGRTYALGVDVASASLTIAPLAGGVMQVGLAGPPGQSYDNAIEASTDLNAANWVTLTNFAATSSGAGAFVDASATNFASRFYRAALHGSNLPDNIITTVAGVGLAGSYAGDGGPATNGGLSLPNGLAVDAAGNLYIADCWNSVVRKVSASGIITTFAGNGFGAGGSGSYSGDGGPATNAGLWIPNGVAVDASGNVFISDLGNARIRKVNTNGIITTVAGNGTFGYSGDGGPAASASFTRSWSLVVDASGNLFFADQENNRVREVSATGIITTVAGNGKFGYSGDGGQATNATLNGPIAIALDLTGGLYISDRYNGRIRKVNTNGVITTFAGNGSFGYSGDGGQAFDAEFDYPLGLALDTNGDLFIQMKATCASAK